MPFSRTVANTAARLIAGITVVGALAWPVLHVPLVGPDAAYGTGEFVGAAYAMEVLPNVGHFVMDQAPAKATDLMLAHLKKHPV